MRFPIFTKTTFLAASLLASAVLVPAEEYSSEDGTNFRNYADRTIEITNETNLTIKSDFIGSGTFVKSGSGVLEIFGSSGGAYQSFITTELASIRTNLVGSRYDLGFRDAQFPNWTGGELVVQSGILELTGYVNLWEDYGEQINTMIAGMPREGRMAGVDKITIYNGARLDVGKSRFLYDGGQPMAGDNIFVFLHNLRAGEGNDQANSVLNVGKNNAGSAKAADDTYHVNIHIDAWDSANADSTLENGGSVGIIYGNANIYKTGEGKLTLLSESRDYTGKFFVAGGSVVLDAAVNNAVSVDVTGALEKAGYGDLEYGRTLWNAGSITIAGEIDSQSGSGSAGSSLSGAARLGAGVRTLYKDSVTIDNNTTQVTYYKEAYFSDPSAGTLVVNRHEAIRNFQSQFANGVAASDSSLSGASAVQNAADRVDTDAPLVAGTGAGSYLAIAEDAVLAVYQEEGKGGIYKGTICGVNESGDAAGVNADGTLVKGGTFVKYGTGDLALMLEGANYEKLALLEGGKVVANITAIDLDPGSYDWTKGETYDAGNWVKDPGLYIADGVNFTLVENATETLKTRLTSSDIHFSSYELIDTIGGAIDVSDERKPGTIELGVEQRFITGEVFVERGLTLVLTAQDLAGYTDADGNYRYYDVNGTGTYTTADGDVFDTVGYYKDAAGERVYYYVDADGVEHVIGGADSERLSYTDSVEFSGGSVGNAKAVILAGKVGTETDLYAGSRTSFLTFNNTNQTVNNLTGDAWSQVSLGRSTLTLNATLDASDGVLATSGTTGNGDTLTYNQFDGAVTGVGNIVKVGSKTLTLGGGASLSYMGATVLREGAIKATRAQSLWNSSLIWMNDETSASFAGSQNWVTLVGGNADLFVGVKTTAESGSVTVEANDLRLGMDASRQSVLNSAYQATDGATLGIIITDDLGNSSRVLKTYPSSVGHDTEELVKAYLKPILDFSYAGVLESWDKSAETKAKEALIAYFKGERLSSSESEALKNLFGGREVSASSPLTVADVTRLYVKLLSGGTPSEALQEATERLAFNGTLTANNIEKIGDDRMTIAGTVSAKSLKISGGVLEMDVDAYGETTFADGITVATGATLAINTGTDASKSYTFNKALSGDGNFEKTGSGSLTLGENVNYFGQTFVSEGDLTMNLRPRAESEVKAQGDITVSNADSTLTLNQTETFVEWTGALTNEGHLVKTGSGTLSLNGVTYLNGNLRVEAGELILSGAEFAGSGKAIVVAGGAVLDLNEEAEATVDRKLSGEGTIEKTGVGSLTLKNTSGEGEFSGIVSVVEGDLYLASENLLSPTAEATLAASGSLYVAADQTLGNLSGDGKIFLNTDSETSLEIELANENSVGYTNGGGSYKTTVNRAVSTDYSEFGAYEGDVDIYGSGGNTAEFEVGGSGTFVFGGELKEKISFTVEDSATLITSVLDRDITLSGENARIILATDASDAELSGKIVAEDITKEGSFKVGKIGTGTLTIESSNSSSWVGAALQVLEGTLRLEGSYAFEFDSAVVASGATLALECTYGVTPKLSEIEGSGTIVLLETASASSDTLELTGTSMLGSVAVDGGRYFNGILDAGDFKITVTGTGVKLASIQTTGGFETSEQVFLAQNHDTTIGGSFNANVVVFGQGCLKIEDVQATGTILVDNGKVQVNAEASKLNNTETGGVHVQNDASIYFTVDADKSDRLSDVEVRLAEGAKVGKVMLVKSGEKTSMLNFDGVADGGQAMLSVSDGLWAAKSASGAQLILGVDQGELVLSGLKSIDASVGLASLASDKSSQGALVIYAGEGDERLDRSISGDGKVAFRGAKTSVVSVNQAYTGETVVEDGATVVFENVSLASALLSVENGGIMKGGVKLVGAPTLAVAAKTLATASATAAVGGNFENNGTVILDVNNGDTIEYAGTFENNGVIRLTGAAAATRGNELVLFKSLSGKTYSTNELELLFGNGKLTNGATSLMISQDGGVISAYAVGSSFDEVSGLRDGLAGSFTDVLDVMGGMDDALDGIVLESDLEKNYGPIGIALNRTSAGELSGEVAKLSPIGYASMVAMARNSFENDWRAISERASHRRYDSSNELYDNGLECFARAQASVVENAGNSDSANFDFNTYGAVVGMDVKPDDFSLYGIALGYDYGSAKLHDSGGKIRSDSFRATAFASGLLGDGSIFLDVGAHFGLNSYDIERNTLVGEAEGDTDGWNAGVAATLGKGFLLSKDKNLQFFVTPYVGLSYLFTKVDAFDESGTAGLEVDSFDAHSVRGRLGATLDWKFPLGDWEARVSLDFAYQHEFVDDEADIEASFKQYRDTAFEVSGIIGSSDAFSVAPSMTIDLSEHNSLSFGYTLQYGTDEQVNHNFNAGFRHCF